MTTTTFKPNALSIGRKIALRVDAILPCPHCERHDLKAFDTAASEAALVLAEKTRVMGRLSGSAEAVADLMRAVVAKAHDVCPECEVSRRAP